MQWDRVLNQAPMELSGKRAKHHAPVQYRSPSSRKYVAMQKEQGQPLNISEKEPEAKVGKTYIRGPFLLWRTRCVDKTRQKDPLPLFIERTASLGIQSQSDSCLRS